MQRRTVLAGVLAALGGCASIDLSGEETPGSDAPPVQAGPAEYPHAIIVENRLDRAVTVNLRVERDGTTIYDRSHEVRSGAEKTVAGFSRVAFQPDRRYVTVRAATPDGGSASVGVSVTDCLGDVVVTLKPGGTPKVTYSVC